MPANSVRVCVDRLRLTHTIVYARASEHTPTLIRYAALTVCDLIKIDERENSHSWVQFSLVLRMYEVHG